MISQSRELLLRWASSVPSPTRAEVQKQHRLVTAAAVLWTVGVLWLFREVRGGPRPLWLVVVTSLGAVALAIVALLVAVRRGHSMLGPAKPVLVSVVIGVPLLLITCKVAATACANGMADPWVGRSGTRCMIVALLDGSGPFFAILWMRRRSVLEQAHWTGASIGLAAGAIAWALNELRCRPAGVLQVAYLPHFLLGHVMPLVVFIGLGVVLAHWLSPSWPITNISR